MERKNRITWNKLVKIIIFVLCLTVPECLTYAKGVEFNIKKSVSVEVYADDIQWKYKVENGKVYKRLYNYTKNVWIGEWKFVE